MIPIIIIIITMFLLLFTQYCGVLGSFFSGEIKTKKRFYFYLIPIIPLFYLMYVIIVKGIKKFKALK